MKKNILFGILTFVFMFIGISNVYAADPITLTQADFDEAKASGTASSPTAKGLWYYVNGSDHLFILGRNTDYEIQGAINLDNGEGTIELVNNNLTLNGVTLTGGIKTESSTTNTLSGDAIVSNDVLQSGGTLTINGNIEFNGLFTSANADSTIINGGKFNNGIMAKQNTDITINNAIVKTGNSMSNAIQVDHYSTIVINNATVTADNVAVASDEDGDVTINGGTFTGKTAGLFIGNGTCKLSGGTFKTTGERNIWGKNGAIAIATTMQFADLLEVPYIYSAATDYSDSTEGPIVNFRFLNAREISVVDDSDEPAIVTTTTTEEKKEETKNPKTGDNILVYISMLLLSVLGVASLRLYKNN